MPYCKECRIEVISLSSHNRTTKHKQNCSLFLTPNLKLVQTAFKQRILTYHISSDSHFTDVDLYLQTLKDKVIELLRKPLKIYRMIKVNMELYGRYMLALTNKFEIKSFNTRYVVIDQYTNLEDFYTKYQQILVTKASEFSEMGSGWAVSKLLFLEVNISKLKSGGNS